MNGVRTARLDASLVRELGILLVFALVLMAGLSLLVGCERVDYRAIPGDSIRSGWASTERPSAVAIAPTQQDFALPSQMSDILEARLDVLRQLTGNEFDRAYARNVGVMAQEEALVVFERAADRHGARVQRFAAEQLPALRKHLEQARELASELDKTTMA